MHFNLKGHLQWWERRRDHPSPDSLTQGPQWLRLAQAAAPSRGVSHVSGRSPGAGPSSALFPEHMNRELDGKWKSWDSLTDSMMLYICVVKPFNLLTPPFLSVRAKVLWCHLSCNNIYLVNCQLDMLNFLGYIYLFRDQNKAKTLPSLFIWLRYHPLPRNEGCDLRRSLLTLRSTTFISSFTSSPDPLLVGIFLCGVARACA